MTSGTGPHRRRRGRRSLVVRLVVPFLLLSAITVASLGALTYQRARGSLQDQVFDRLAGAAELKADALDRWVDDQRRNVVFVSGLLGGGIYGGRRQALSPLRDQVGTLLDDDPGSKGWTAARDQIVDVLDFVVTNTADAQEFVILNQDGDVVASTVSPHEGRNVSSEPFFQHGISNTFVQPVSSTDLSDASAITAATPLFDSGGRTI